MDRYKIFTRNQEAGEACDAFLTELKVLAANSNFGDLKDSFIRDRIICGINSSVLRERLLRQTELDLDKCVKAFRASELSKANMNILEGQSSAIHAMRQTPIPDMSIQKRPKDNRDMKRLCKFCG